MNIQQIRQRTAYNPCAKPTQKTATRNWLGGLAKDYPLSLTLTLNQFWEVRNERGVYLQKINRNECKRIAKQFTHSLNKQIFGNSAKRHKLGLKYLVVMEGERSCKNLHLHMAIGNIPTHVKWNTFDSLVSTAKKRIVEIATEHKVDVVDSGWVEYITKELGRTDTDNVFWELA